MWRIPRTSNQYQSFSFFYLILKRGNSEEIQRMFQALRKSSSALMKNLVELAWFMRGSLDYEYAFNLTHMEREAIRDFLSERMEKMEQKKMVPIY